MHEISKSVGSVFQNPRTQFLNVDTDSEIAFGMENMAWPTPNIADRLECVSADMQIEALRGRNIFALSGGEKQKIAFAMSENGARGLARGSIYNLLYYISLMVPMSLVVRLLDDTLPYLASGGPFVFRYGVYAGTIVVSLIVSGFLYYQQFTSVFFTVYGESEEKCLQLGEKLRRHPLSFFGSKDLSDLTNTMMGDVNTPETVQSHAIPQMIGSAGSTIVIAILMKIWDWRMELALCWVVPVVMIITLCSASFQKKHAQNHFEIKRQVSDQTQENIEHMADILASNQGDAYLEDYKRLLAQEENPIRYPSLPCPCLSPEVRRF